MSKKVLNKRSNQVVNGKAKLPIASELDYGEIAINYHDGVESISIKNDSGEVVTFATEENLNKTELKSDQEFTYRKTGVDWDAKAATIKSIKGNTLAWNNLVPEFDTWIGNYGSVEYTGNTVLYTVTTVKGGTTQNFGSFGHNNLISGHKYYHSFNVKVDKDSTIYLGGDVFGNASRALNITGNTWYHYRNVCLGNWDGNANYYFALQNSDGGLAVGDKMYIQEPMMIDLTLMYGNKISGLSDNQILALIAKDFNDCYYPSNNGKLISNDASGIETVGFNQWDEEWEEGALSGGNGQPASGFDASRIRSKNYCPCFPNTTYNANYVGSSYASNYPRVFWYDANKNFIYATFAAGVSTSPPNAAFFKINTEGTTYGNVYKNDICINLSDASRNGQYEPYRKSTLSLGLESIKVKSHNIWDEEWELGIYNPATGEKVISSSNIRCKNLIPVFPSIAYYISGGLGQSAPLWYGRIFEYDANGNFVMQYDTPNRLFTTSTSCRYITFHVATEYGTTYNNDICINLSSSFNGQYEPYGDITITGGLKSAGNVYDEIVGNKYVKRIAEYTFTGNEGWIKNGSAPQYTSQVGLFVGRKRSESYWHTTANVLHPKLITASQSAMYNGSVTNAIGCGDSIINDNVVIDEVAYTNRATLLTGTTAYYELASPVVYELVEPIQSVYMVDKDGTERAINPTHEDNTPSAPFRGDIQYGVSHGDIAMDTTKLAEKVSNIDTQLDGIETLLSLI